MEQDKKCWVGGILFFSILLLSVSLLSFRTGESILLSSFNINNSKKNEFIGEARDGLGWWMALHEKLVEKARVSTASIAVYGDSITE